MLYERNMARQVPIGSEVPGHAILPTEEDR